MAEGLMRVVLAVLLLLVSFDAMAQAMCPPLPPPSGPTIEKYPLTFDIDLLRCIYCGLCEEACPCDAIRMDTGIYEIAADDRAKFVVGMDFLLHNKTDGTH